MASRPVSDQAATSPDPVGYNGKPDQFSIYSGEPVVALDEIMENPGFPEVVNSLEPDGLVLAGGGATTDILFCHEGPEGFSLANVRFAPEAILPAHKHNVDCLYFVKSGWIMLGQRRLDVGAGFYVPAGAVYGYRAGEQGAEVLEFRHATRFDITVTENSLSRWQQIVDVARAHNGWPGVLTPEAS